MFGKLPSGDRGEHQVLIQVESTVTTYNYKQYMFNLKRGYWTHYFRPTNETTEAHTIREHMRDSFLDTYNDHRTRYLDHITNAMAEADHELRNMSAKDKKSAVKVEEVKLQITQLKQCLSAAKDMNPLPGPYNSVDEIPPRQKLYYELDAITQRQFWEKEWNLQTATNVYWFARDVIVLEKNLEDDNMGVFMATTWCYMAH